ncbi:MAG: hypothetical protein JNL73_17750 [Anaerolineales bacterium]|nr:hypothetical protein [Anaerolineales bacterium]
MTQTVAIPVTKPMTAQLGMTLEEARRTLWISEDPRPMGELLDSGFLTAEKLAWAARATCTLRLQAAAKVLLRELQKPATPQAPVHPVEQAQPLAAQH